MSDPDSQPQNPFMNLFGSPEVKEAEAKARIQKAAVQSMLWSLLGIILVLASAVGVIAGLVLTVRWLR